MGAKTQPMIPRHKDKKFKNDQELQQFIKQHCHLQILFESQGQDLEIIWIDNRGEILNSDMQNWLWIGKFVKIESVKTGKPIEMHFEDKGWVVMQRLVVEEIVR